MLVSLRYLTNGLTTSTVRISTSGIVSIPFSIAAIKSSGNTQRRGLNRERVYVGQHEVSESVSQSLYLKYVRY